MKRNSIAGVAILGTLGVALVLGTQILKGDPSGSAVVTVLGFLGLGISQLLQGSDTQVTKQVTEELSKDLRNGTFEKLLREALTKLAHENGVPLEIQQDSPDSNSEKGGNVNG